MFDLNFQSGDGPLTMIALDPELGERDALSATVQEASGPGEKITCIGRWDRATEIAAES